MDDRRTDRNRWRLGLGTAVLGMIFVALAGTLMMKHRSTAPPLSLDFVKSRSLSSVNWPKGDPEYWKLTPRGEVDARLSEQEHFRGVVEDILFQQEDHQIVAAIFYLPAMPFDEAVGKAINLADRYGLNSAVLKSAAQKGEAAWSGVISAYNRDDTQNSRPEIVVDVTRSYLPDKPFGVNLEVRWK